jgi:hypothetical protein
VEKHATASHHPLLPAVRNDQPAYADRGILSDVPPEIRAAQQRLEQQRADLGITPPPPQTTIHLQPPVILPLQSSLPFQSAIGDTPRKRSTQAVTLTARKVEKIVLIPEMEAEKRLDLGCLARPLVRCQIPMTDPKSLPNPLCYQRTDGDRTTRLVTTSAAHGLPYGGDLITIYGLCTKGRELYKTLRHDWDGTVSFSSTAEMLRYFGDPATTYYYDLRMASLLRIWHSRLEIEDTLKRLGYKRPVQKKLTPMTFLGPVTLWFQLEDRQMGMPFKNVIQFSPEMIQQIKDAPMFEDVKVFWLKKAVGALQLYLFLRDRCAQEDLRDKGHGWIPVHGPNSLETQLGWVKLLEPKKVRSRISNWLKLLRASVWPNCPGELHLGNDGNWRLKIWYIPPVRRS